MDTGAVTGFLEEVNRQIDATLLLKRIAYATDRIQSVGDSIKAFCPIHRDTRYRTLLVDQKKHSYKCTIKTCAGYGGGSLVELFALARQTDPVTAANELIGALDLQVDTASFSLLSQSLLAEAETAFVNGDHEKAEQAGRQALEFKPDCAEARLLLANIHIARGETAQASDEFIAVAETYLLANSFAEADELLAAASRMLPDNEDLVFMKVRSAELQGHKDQAVKLLQDVAAARESSGRGADNVGIYEQLLALNPTDVAVRVKLGDVCEMRRDIKRACREWEQAADAFLAAHDLAEAIRLYERVLKFEPQMNRMRMRLAEALMQEGEYAAARQHIFEVVNNQLSQSDFASAAQSARKWLDVEPESVEAHEALARIYQEQMQLPDAAEELRAAAMLLEKRGEKERALEFLFRVKFLIPDNLELRRQIIERLIAANDANRAAFELLDIAEVLFGQDNPAEAEAALEHAAAVCAVPDLQVQIADALKSHGRIDAACSAYRRAASAADQDPRTNVKCLDKLLELAPDDAEAQAARGLALLRPPFAGKKHIADAANVAKTLLAGSKPESVLPLLHAVLEVESLEPKHARTFFDVALELAETNTALKLYEKVATTLKPEEPAKLLDFARRTVAAISQAELPLRDIAELAGGQGNPEEAVKAHGQLADIYQARGETATVLHHVEAALGFDKNSPELLKRRADLIGQLKDPKQARRARSEYVRSLRGSADVVHTISEYERYLADYADDAELRGEVVEMLVDSGETARASEHLFVLLSAAEKAKASESVIEILEQLLALDPGNAACRVQLAQTLAKTNDRPRAVLLYLEACRQFLEVEDSSQAIAAARAAQKLAPNNSEVLETRAEAERTLGDTPGYRECLDKLVKLGRPRMAIDRLQSLGVAALEAGKYKDAEEYAEQWVGIEPEALEPLSLLARAYRGGNRTQRAVETFVRLAAKHLEAGTPDGAVSALRAALEVDPENTEVRQQLWQTLLDAGHQEEALTEMQQLADIFVERRSYKEASAILSRILEFRTKSADTLQRLASLICEHEGFQKALPYYRKLLALRRETSSHAEVLKQYRDVLEIEGATVDLRIEFAEYLETIGNPVLAKEQLLQTAQIFRDELSDTNRAIFFFERAASILPEPADARIQEELATLHIAERMPAEAANSLREAVKLYDAVSDGPKAMAALERLAGLKGVAAQDLINLAERLVAAGKRTEAIARYRQALDSITPSSSRAKTERRSICEAMSNLDPLDISGTMMLLECLDRGEVEPRIGALVAPFREAQMSKEQKQLLVAAKEKAPDSLPIRQLLISYWHDASLKNELRTELVETCRLANAQHNRDVAHEVLAQLPELTHGAAQKLELAQLQAGCGNTEQATGLFAECAQEFADGDDFKQAVAALNEAIELDAGTVQASQVAGLIRKAPDRKPIRELANRYLESALRARSRTRALVVGVALLESGNQKDNDELLGRTFEKAGGAFLVAIAGAHADGLLEANQKKRALAVADFTTKVAPNSPDAWWLVAQFRRKVGDSQAAAEASLRAAKLFSEAGAVTEEETCYREALEEAPEDAAVLETLAFFYERERRNPDALEMVRRLVAIALASGDSAKTIQWLRRGIDLAPQDREFREQLVHTLVGSGHKEQAVEQLAELAVFYTRAQEYAKAIASYEQMVELQGETEPVVAHLLDAAFQTEDLERIVRYSHSLADLKADSGALKQACQILNALLEKDPDNLQALEKLANFSKRGQDDRNYCMALNALGHKFAKNGRYAEAIAKFEELLKRRQGNLDILEMLLDCSVAEGANKRILKHGELLAEAAEQQHDYQRMRVAAEALLTADANRTSARQCLAEALHKLGQKADAIQEWSAAAEQYQAEKKYEEGAECLRRITEIDPDNLSVWKRFADLLVLQGDSEAARTAYFRLADSYVASGELNSAEAVMTRLLQIDPDDVQTHRKALALYRQGKRIDAASGEVQWLARRNIEARDYTAADLLLQEGLELDPDNLDFQEMRIEVSRKLARTDEVQFRLRELGQRFVKEGDVPRAIQTYEELKATAPDSLDIRRELATLYAKLGRSEEAADEYAYLVKALLDRSESEEARETAERALALRQGDIALTAKLADAFSEHGMQDLAARYYVTCATCAAEARDEVRRIRFLQRATECRPRWLEGLEQLAEALIDKGENEPAVGVMKRLEAALIEQKKFSDAASVLRRHIGLSPREVEPRRMLVDVYSRTGDRENRIAELQDLADLLLSLGKIDEVVEIYHDLTRLRPDDITLLMKYTELFSQVGNELEIIGDYIRLAEAQGRRGLIADAIRTYERVLEIDRRKTETRERFIEFLMKNGQQPRAIVEMGALADIYSRAKNHSSALRMLTEAVELQPRNAEAIAALAKGHQNAGNMQEAARQYARAASVIAAQSPKEAVTFYENALAAESDDLELRTAYGQQLRLIGDNVKVAANARKMAELYSARGEMDLASACYDTASENDPETLETLAALVAEHAHDPGLQYLDYVRYGDRLAARGDIDRALEAYRSARALDDESTALIQKYIDAYIQIAPEHEAVNDYLLLAERLLAAGNVSEAMETYDHILLLDPQNNAAKAGRQAANPAAKRKSSN